MRERQMPDNWLTFSTQCLLGCSLVGQKKHDEAESLLLSGFRGMQERENSIPAKKRVRIQEALDALIKLYDDWGKPEEAAKWREVRDGQPSPSADHPSPGTREDKGG